MLLRNISEYDKDIEKRKKADEARKSDKDMELEKERNLLRKISLTLKLVYPSLPLPSSFPTSPSLTTPTCTV